MMLSCSKVAAISVACCSMTTGVGFVLLLFFRGRKRVALQKPVKTDISVVGEASLYALSGKKIVLNTKINCT